MHDPTETIRRNMAEEINSEKTERKRLEDKYGEVMTTAEMQEKFSVEGFLAPLVVVRRKSDGKRGTLMFSHSPRFYFRWQED